MKVYLCDFKKCAVCQKYQLPDNGCRHTTDPEHALHKGMEMQFETLENGDQWEVGEHDEAGRYAANHT